MTGRQYVHSRTLRNLTTESFVRMGTANCSPSPTSQTAHLLPAPHPPASTHPPPRPRRCPPFAPSGVRRLTVSTGNAPRTRRALADRQPRRPLSGAAPDPPACPPRSAPRRLARDGRGREWAAWTPSPPAAVGRPIGVRLEAWRAFHTGAAVGPRQPASPTARAPPPPAGTPFVAAPCRWEALVPPRSRRSAERRSRRARLRRGGVPYGRCHALVQPLCQPRMGGGRVVARHPIAAGRLCVGQPRVRIAGGVASMKRWEAG